MKLSAAILAGGKSLRMGKDKSFLTHNGQPFLGLVIKQLADFDEVFISVNGGEQKKEYREFLDTIKGDLPASMRLTTIEDKVKEIGPLGGIYSSLDLCEHEHLFVCAADMPLLKKELLEFMALFINGDHDCFVIRNDTKIHTLCAIYSKSVLPIIEGLIKEKRYSMLALLDRAKTKYIPLEYSRFAPDVLTNINTPEEFSELNLRQNCCVKPPVFCVSGVKNSGKTLLICKLLAAMKQKGWNVGVIKHDGHDFEIDVENTDTHKYMQAGSGGVSIYSQKKYAIIRRWDAVQSKAQLEFLLEHFADMDLVIIEGLKHSDFPKIETVVERPVCNEDTLLAIATDGKFKHEKIKTVGRSDIETLVKIIEAKIMEGSGR